MNNSISVIDQKLEEFSQRVPAKGMHLGYLSKASELMQLYGEASAILESERTPENEAKLKEVAEEVEEIVGE